MSWRSDYAESISKIRENILALSGVDIMINENQFKDIYTVLEEISKVYNTLWWKGKENVLA